MTVINKHPIELINSVFCNKVNSLNFFSLNNFLEKTVNAILTINTIIKCPIEGVSYV